jgi:hypothetical protein
MGAEALQTLLFVPMDPMPVASKSNGGEYHLVNQTLFPTDREHAGHGESLEAYMTV